MFYPKVSITGTGHARSETGYLPNVNDLARLSSSDMLFPLKYPANSCNISSYHASPVIIVSIPMHGRLTDKSVSRTILCKAFLVDPSLYLLVILGTSFFNHSSIGPKRCRTGVSSTPHPSAATAYCPLYLRVLRLGCHLTHLFVLEERFEKLNVRCFFTHVGHALIPDIFSTIKISNELVPSVCLAKC